uniref:Uncharacterized protein n=1 Tax=Kalmanozyma brasiliensis (strain GHG001) TaxID=1365824 RepID=V5ENQ6_KALBG
MHPALVILLSVLLVQSITLLGKSRLQDILWFLYTSVFHRSTLSSQRSLRRDILSTKRELAATSSQDQFAKWAKLRRKVDKSLADLERTNASLSTARSTFNMLFKGVMTLIAVVGAVGNLWPGKSEEEVLSKAKVEKVEQELEEKKAAAAAQAGSRTAEAGQARRRTNAAAAEKQDL